MSRGKVVAVTGASGFLGGKMVEMLSSRGYKVNATVRSLKTDHKYLRQIDNVTLFESDLKFPESFDDAFENCDCVFHVAAVVAFKAKDPVKEIVEPTVEGMKNVFTSALRMKVPFFVATSSNASIASKPMGRVLDESVFNEDTDPEKEPYPHSKVTSEKLLWKLAEENKEKIKVATICPSLILGPFVGDRCTSLSVSIVLALVNGRWEKKGAMVRNMNTVDIRDVVNAHILAYEKKKFERFLVTHKKSTGALHWAELLREKYPGMKYPTTEPEKVWLDIPQEYDNSKVLELMGTHHLIPLKKTLEDMIEHFFSIGVLQRNEII